jgi:hypothetical protein
MRRKPNSSAGAARVFAHHVGIVEFGGHVVDRNHAVAQRGGGDFAFGARNQRMRKLARRTHGAAGNGAVMGADEIHQAEVDRFDMGQGGDLPHLVQRAGRFDQHMDRYFALDAMWSARTSSRATIWVRASSAFATFGRTR